VSLPERALPWEGLRPAAAPAAVPRRWIGAPDSAWNPTVSLALAVVAGSVTLAVGLQTGRLDPWLVVPALAICYYAAFTVLHEATHGIAHRNRRINAALGRIASVVLLLPYPLFRTAHLTHHAHTNDPERDPDLMVAWRPAWLRPVWLLLTPAYYRAMVYGSGLLRDAASRRETFASESLLVAVIVAAVVLGQGTALLQLWLLPASLAILWLAFAFDLLPHHPHTTRERYYDTRIYPGRVLNALLLGQNYHLIHHLWNTIPWYRYERAFREVEDDLVARGAPIGWHSRAERPSA
jgi:beta-carotene hydroxylase